MLSFDPDRTVREMTCPKCQRSYLLITLFVHRDGGAHATCYAALHDHEGIREAWIDAVLGSWGKGETTDHVTFGCRVGPVAGQREPAASLVTGGMPFGDAPILGKRLTREEALMHPWLSDYWEVVDFVLVKDPAVHAHLYGRDGSALTSNDGTGSWQRPLWRPGGGDALVSYAVFGRFDEAHAESISGLLPEGLKCRLLGADAVAELTVVLGPSHRAPKAFERAAAAQSCLWITGTVPDPPNLEYLRPVVDIVADLLQKADGVLDMNAIVFQGLEQWSNKVVEGILQPFNFIATYWWAEDDGDGQWWRTRGMLTFGRPDISLRHVPASVDQERVLGALRKLGVDLAHGLELETGDSIGPVIFDVADATQDPMFLNRRAEAEWTPLK